MLKCFGIRSEEVLNYISKYNLLTDGPEKHKKDVNVLSFTPRVSIQVQWHIWNAQNFLFTLEGKEVLNFPDS